MRRQEGATAFRHVPPQRVGQQRRALEFSAHPRAAVAQPHSNRRMEKNPSPHQQPPVTQGCCRDRRLERLIIEMMGQGRLPMVQHKKPPRPPKGEARNSSERGSYEGQPSQGGQCSVQTELSWLRGCLVAMVLSSSSYKGCNHCGRSPAGQALGLGSSSA